MVQNQAELDKIIIESQDFEETTVKKGINCWQEEFVYLLRRTFDANNELYVSRYKRISFSSDYVKPLSNATANNFLQNILEGKNQEGYPTNQGVPIHLIKNERGFFKGFSHPIEICSINHKPIMQIEENLVFSQIEIKVYAQEFMEPAKTFAKSYKKWCGQEATVTKEYVETEERARQTIKLERIIGAAKRGEEKINDINELEEEPTVTLIRSEEAIKIMNQKQEEEYLRNTHLELKETIRKLENGNVYFAKYDELPAYFQNKESIITYFSILESGWFSKKQDLYHMSINCSADFLTSKKVNGVELSVTSEKHLERVTTLANKLKQELNTPVKIVQKY